MNKDDEGVPVSEHWMEKIPSQVTPLKGAEDRAVDALRDASLLPKSTNGRRVLALRIAAALVLFVSGMAAGKALPVVARPVSQEQAPSVTQQNDVKVPAAPAVVKVAHKPKPKTDTTHLILF